MHHRVEAAVLRTRERASSPGCRRRFRASRGVEVKGRGITFVIVVDLAPVSPHSKLSFGRVQLVPHWGSYEVFVSISTICAIDGWKRDVRKLFFSNLQKVLREILEPLESKKQH